MDNLNEERNEWNERNQPVKARAPEEHAELEHPDLPTNAALTGDEEKRLIHHIHEKVTEIAANIERTQIADYVTLMNKPRRLIFANLIAGISRGVGLGLGITVFAGTILYALKALGALNLPIIGTYIADLVEYVQFQLEGRRFY
ncbi:MULTISPECIES: DUF5665 domain-containing protein [unclassified Paenibacillus]|uniref:DUF5665 domain-containing protein n=1 Tax=unclassified Paenibacillus TaxID=185978 RepID=UPI00020D7B4E|nr:MULTISPECIES: DUF5665 domain-containing protein [unclassified Paenibacillus]EGL19737.1 hypothetical protein HMPREF9413_3600 [Paenibacillus sp. HGF7]EPD92262.1 hypothetical protein HMPREF1207_00932 [Paenibacillus sp. HGH0039]